MFLLRRGWLGKAADLGSKHRSGLFSGQHATDKRAALLLLVDVSASASLLRRIAVLESSVLLHQTSL
jgi:hypothetical protein